MGPRGAVLGGADARERRHWGPRWGSLLRQPQDAQDTPRHPRTPRDDAGRISGTPRSGEGGARLTRPSRP
eukprot:5668073-Pyramimonas_sp.AAC.1